MDKTRVGLALHRSRALLASRPPQDRHLRGTRREKVRRPLEPRESQIHFRLGISGLPATHGVGRRRGLSHYVIPLTRETNEIWDGVTGSNLHAGNGWLQYDGRRRQG